jgi:uncharacterized protein (DUF433 family)
MRVTPWPEGSATIWGKPGTGYNIRGGSPCWSLTGSQCLAVESVPGKVGGAWVFRGTRMPVATVFENLEEGMSIDELVEMYDGLTREQVRAVLEFAARSLEAPAQAP